MSDRLTNAGIKGGDIAAAVSLLTRVPVWVDHDRAGARAAAAVWAFPLVGALLGFAAALVIWGAQLLGAPTGVAGALGLAALVLATGALHEDGLADCADGLGGGSNRQRRLEIMHDSRIGAYGAAALCLSLIARWSAIEVLAQNGSLFWPLIAVGAVSRLPMVLAMFAMDPARRDGLSAGVGMPPPGSVLLACTLAGLIGLIAVGWGVFGLLFWALIAPLPLFWLAGKLVGGQTGDILGGSQQLAEIAALAVVAQ